MEGPQNYAHEDEADSPRERTTHSARGCRHPADSNDYVAAVGLQVL